MREIKVNITTDSLDKLAEVFKVSLSRLKNIDELTVPIKEELSIRQPNIKVNVGLRRFLPISNELDIKTKIRNLNKNVAVPQVPRQPKIDNSSSKVRINRVKLNKDINDIVVKSIINIDDNR